MFPDLKQKSKVSFVKRKNDKKNFNNWLEGNGREFQSTNYSQAQVQEVYENYLNESLNGSTSSQESVSKMSHQKEVKAVKVDVSQGKVEKQKLKVETSPFHEYISMRKDDVVDLIDNIKTKVRNWFFSSSLHNTFQDNV